MDPLSFSVEAWSDSAQQQEWEPSLITQPARPDSPPPALFSGFLLAEALFLFVYYVCLGFCTLKLCNAWERVHFCLAKF